MSTDTGDSATKTQFGHGRDGVIFSGYKRAWVILETRGIPVSTSEHVDVIDAGFCGHSVPLTYRREAEAVCGQGAAHARMPGEACVCGFYALKDREAIERFRFAGAGSELGGVSSAVLSVRFHGDVIEGEAGWRAGRQTVTNCELSNVCGWCSRKAVYVVGGEMWHPTLNGALLWGESACAECARTHGVTRPLTISDLSGLLGLDVGWALGQPAVVPRESGRFIN